ncbi:MAG TPA: choice-of-anchor B family protein [Gemmatimonadales bacterium]
MPVTARCAVLAVAIMVLVAPLRAQTNRNHRTAPPATGFGTAIVVSGNEIYVGQPGEFPLFPAPPTGTGAVHRFSMVGGNWVEGTPIVGDGVMLGDGFGQALALHGDIMIVGAPKQDEQRGVAYVFERSGMGAAWAQTARLQANDGTAGDSLGFAVAVEGDIALLGAPGHGEMGAVYVFHRMENGTWEQHHRLDPMGAGASPGDRFGAAVSLGDGRALIGAPGTHPAPALFGPPPTFGPGSAYVIRHDHGGAGWVQEERLEAPEGVRTFGATVRIDAGGAFIAAPVTGALFPFKHGDSGVWEALPRIGPSGPGQGMFGASFARAGETLLVGSPGANGGSGAVVAFGWDAAANAWSEKQLLAVNGFGFVPFFGAAVAASEHLAVLGAPGADFFEGVGYVFTPDPTSGDWKERASIVNADAGIAAVTGGQIDCTDGSARGFTCSDVDLVAFLPLKALGAKRGIMVNDIWGWTDGATGKEYALLGRFDATTFIDISDPANPVYLGELPLTEGAVGNLWRDIKVYQDHAFIVADGAGPHGVQIFDLTQLRRVVNPPIAFQETAHYDGIFSAHNIVINEETGFAYTVGNSMGGETCGGGLHMIDIRSPAEPTFAGCFADAQTGNASTGYTHDAQCVAYHGPDGDHAGKEICFNASETALGIADVSDKEHPVAVSRGTYPNVGYTHQGWISDDHRHFYVNDELDELAGSTPKTRTLVWDIEDLDDPVLLTEFLGTTAASDHNLYVRGRYMYQSNYVSGLRIIDIGDPAHPVEVGFFDTVPFGDDAPGFAGSWSNYPYFASGVIIVSSMREGLFILKKRETRLVP